MLFGASKGSVPTAGLVAAPLLRPMLLELWKDFLSDKACFS